MSVATPRRLNYCHLTSVWAMLAVTAVSYIFISPSAVKWRCTGPTAASCANGTGNDNGDALTTCCAQGTQLYSPGSEGSSDELCELPRSAWEFVNPSETVTTEFELVCDQSWKVRAVD